MKLDGFSTPVHLTYCTNIHAGESWSQIRDSLDNHVPAIKAAVAPYRPLGIGLRLSGEAAARARHPEELAAFRDQMTRLGAYVFTINAFPFGRFHGTRVKSDVYLPDWRGAERVRFTADCAAVLAAMLPEGIEGSISTVPGAFKPNGATEAAVATMASHLLLAVADLVAIERRTGKRITLALEPEPCCFLETTEESIAFFEKVLLSPASLDRLATAIGDTRRGAETALRRHLGICYDVCHGSVEFEDPVAALRRLRASGIAVPKLQLSTAIRLPVMTRDLIHPVMRYNDGVYLHQTVVRGPGGLVRYVDLPDAIMAFKDGRAEGEWRVHCHVPVFLSDLGELSSTQGDLMAVLAACRSGESPPHLEVETYTWDVLPPKWRTDSKAADIAREISFCAARLAA